MRLIVAEVVYEEPKGDRFGMAMPKPEGCTWYPDARVIVATREGTPDWLGAKRERRRKRERNRRHAPG
jgi:hypothetical protein